MSREIEIRARELQLGDDIRLYEPDPAEPLTRMPWAPDRWWTVSALMGGGNIDVHGIGGITHRESTVIAECVRELSREDLDLDEQAWAGMLTSMKLDVRTQKIRLTERKTFIHDHRLTVRRADMDPEARDLEERVRHAS